MKKSVLLKSVIVFAILILAAKLNMAAVPDPGSVNELKQVLKEQLSYPAYAQQNLMTGYVVVAFIVNQDGHVVINGINASSSYFKEYVEEKLKDVVVPNAEKFQGQTNYYRFDFKLIDNY